MTIALRVCVRVSVLTLISNGASFSNAVMSTRCVQVEPPIP